jgi:Ran GTPase-activating protein 1
LQNQVVNASDIFTSRLLDEIPQAVKAICDALEDKQSLVELNFSDNAFGPAGAEPMVDFLTNNRWLQVLKLNNNGLGVRGGTIIGQALLEAAKKNNEEGRKSSLRTIVAGRNRLENGSSKYLANAFAAHGTLVEISLPQNGIRSEGIATFARRLAACKDLELIDFQDNTFTTGGSLAFAEALPEWSKLKHLNIGDCMLEVDGGVAIVEALLRGCNNQLETLNLQYNEVDRRVASLLANAISSQLKKLSSLELNGNKIHPEDSSIADVKAALEEHGHEDALGELYDMELSEDEEEDDDDEGSDEDRDKTKPLPSKSQDQTEKLADALASVHITL